MRFWRHNMPEAMPLRSGLDADGVDTLEAVLAQRGADPAAVRPDPLRTFMEYAEWSCAQTGVRPRPTRVPR